jgi:hypothetical protein
MDIWSIYGRLVYFVVAIWYFYGHIIYFSRFGKLYQEKSGNPDQNSSAEKPIVHPTTLEQKEIVFGTFE